MTERSALIQEAYKILGRLTPLKSDCGRLCNAACCKGDSTTGMLLFPDEEELYSENEFNIIDANGKKLLVCNGTCNRDKRPLACRIFPLAIVKLNGRVQVIADPRSIPVCPLYRQALVGRLDPGFQKAVKTVAQLFGKSGCFDDFLEALGEECSDIQRLYGAK